MSPDVLPVPQVHTAAKDSPAGRTADSKDATAPPPGPAGIPASRNSQLCRGTPLSPHQAGPPCSSQVLP